jgi:hypothetical protein
MKTLNRILLVSAIAASFALAHQTNAGDKTVLLSPKARQMQESLGRSGLESKDMLDRSSNPSPKQRAMQGSLRRSPMRENDVLVRNAVPGNARFWANHPAGAPTLGQPVYLAPSK